MMSQRTLALRTASTLLFLLLLLSCRTQRAVPAAEMPTRQWHSVRVPVNMRIEEPMRASIGAQLTMVADSAIALSARFFGMEVFAAQIDSNSVTAVERMNKRYISEDLTDFLAQVPVGVSDVQSILTGKPFELPKDIKYDGIELNAVTTDSLMSVLTVKRPHHDPVTVSYSSPVTTPYGSMASTVTITIPGRNGKAIRAVLDFNYAKARWDSDASFKPLKIPGSYTKIRPDEALKALPTPH